MVYQCILFLNALLHVFSGVVLFNLNLFGKFQINIVPVHPHCKIWYNLGPEPHAIVWDAWAHAMYGQLLE